MGLGGWYCLDSMPCERGNEAEGQRTDCRCKPGPGELGEDEGTALGLGAISARWATTFLPFLFLAGEASIRTVGGTKFSTTPITGNALCECDTPPALLRKRALTSVRWRGFRSGMESWRKLRNVQSR